MNDCLGWEATCPLPTYSRGDASGLHAAAADYFFIRTMVPNGLVGNAKEVPVPTRAKTLAS